VVTGLRSQDRLKYVAVRLCWQAPVRKQRGE